MTGNRQEPFELTSFSQLIQELIAGVIRRHIFTVWERDFLLDLQTSGVRKSKRAEVLRRYLRTVQQHCAVDSSPPLRLSHFLETEQRQRRRRPRVARQASSASA